MPRGYEAKRLFGAFGHEFETVSESPRSIYNFPQEKSKRFGVDVRTNKRRGLFDFAEVE
jgi:hypothetical protein